MNRPVPPMFCITCGLPMPSEPGYSHCPCGSKVWVPDLKALRNFNSPERPQDVVRVLDKEPEEIEPSCGGCQFFVPEDVQGRCRRFPPTSVKSSDGTVYERWPVVQTDQWCGEFHPKGFER